MFHVAFFENSESNKWLIRQFELFRLNESFMAEKFVPRPDISIMFHFRDTPFILEDNEIQLEPFFATPILSKSLSLNLHGKMDTFVVVCKPTVFSRIFDVNLSPVPK
ncbi:MAG: AraC family transcriptional regulator, partial [Bacteroidetes bacterium]|nr:AraC family transcriptional regulator [Bacteroidota bacterium]